MKLAEALKTGSVIGIPDVPETTVETIMSEVFLYPTKVIKLYKDDRKGFFTDLRDPVVRKSFYGEDFTWNYEASKRIHNALHGVQKNGEGAYELTAPEDADNWIIEMERVAADDTLFHRLSSQTATKDHVASLARSQTQALDRLTNQYLHEFEDLLERGLQELWRDRLDEDLRHFGKQFTDSVPADTTDDRVNSLLRFFKEHDYFNSLTSEHASVAIDNHAGNVVFHNEQPEFIDIHLPKREWRLIDRNNNIARIATCVRVLGSNELADAMYDAYQDHHELAPAEIISFQEAYNAFIKGYYYTYLKQPDIAEKYFTFADATLAKITN